MKIVHVCQYYNDGYGYQENLLPRYQQKLGHHVSVITSDRTTFFGKSNTSNLVAAGISNDAGIEVVRLPIKGQFRNRFVWFKNLQEELERQKPDYIFHHGLTSPSLVQCAKYKRKYSIFLAADNHADLNISAHNVIWRLLYYQYIWMNILKNIINYIDIVFGVTPARCSFVEKYLGIPADKIRLLPIGADTDAAKKVLNGRQVEKLRKNKNSLLLVTGGKWTKEKRLDVLLDAIKGLDVELHIFGDIRDDMIQKKLKKQGNVLFLGWKNREETMKTLSEADIALWAGPHTTLMEDAVASNTPMLLRYHGSTSHHIRGNGAYFFSSNSLEIRQILRFILENPSILEAMKVQALKQSRMFSYDQVARDSVAYFNDLTPKPTHQYFMDDPLCLPGNVDFERISQ